MAPTIIALSILVIGLIAILTKPDVVVTYKRYRVISKKGKYYPQKRGILFWRYYEQYYSEYDSFLNVERVSFDHMLDAHSFIMEKSN